MTEATERGEAKGVADHRAQRELTSKVGATLTRRSKPSNGKWGTLKGRFGRGRT